MIKIEIENIDLVKKEYFDGIKGMILRRVNFYLTAFKVMDRRPGFTINNIVLYPGIATKSKTAFLRILGRKKTSFKTKAHYSRLQNQNSLSIHFYSNRNGYINLLTSLSIEANLKALVLEHVDNLLTKDASYTHAWFTAETKKFIKEIIPYDEFIDKETKPFNAYELSSLLKVNVCVYCNRVYTTTVIGTGRDLIIRPTLDHFFSQSEHPLLGLSFYNLIPSCNYCNSNLKGIIPFNLNHHVHPYKEGFDKDATFDYLQKAFHADKSDPRNYLVLIRKNIANTNSRYARIFGNGGINEGNTTVFKLEEVYKAHADIVGELIVKSDKYSPYYAGNVISMLARLGATKKDFYRFYFGNYLDERDFNKRPLAKLTKDIVSKYLPEIID